MNKIIQFVKETQSKKRESQIAVISLSNKIIKKIGFEELPKKFDYKTGKYRVILTSRVFDEFGWVNLLEIQLADNTPPDWCELEGTATINLPPQKIQDEFFKELENHIK